MPVIKVQTPPGLTAKARDESDSTPDDEQSPALGLKGWMLWGALAVWTACVDNTAWILSAVFHLGLAACVAGLFIHFDRGNVRMGIESAVLDAVGEESFENALGTPDLKIVGTGEAGISFTQPTDMTRQATEGDAEAQLSDLIRFGSAGVGDGSGDGNAPGLVAGFFGAQGEGKSFVYVVDMSGSMAGQRFSRAVSELIRSINKLKPEQMFFVYFFNDRTYPLFDPRPAKGMLAATANNKGRAARWIRTRTPSAQTNPLMALERALEMKPDAIFLLTDGELDNSAEVRHMLRQRNTSGISIHTIAFENEEAATDLETIAKENKGTFRFIK